MPSTLTCGTGGTYATLALALAAAGNGDTIVIKDGTYSGAGWQSLSTTLTDLQIVAETASTQISNVGSSTLLRLNGTGSTINGGRWITNYSGASNCIRISQTGCTIKNASFFNLVSGSKYCIYYDHGSVMDLAVQACTFVGYAYGEGFAIGLVNAANGNDLLIDDCEISEFSEGIVWGNNVTDTDSGVIKRCKIHDCEIGINYARSCTIQNCLMYDSDYGIYRATSATVQYCTIDQCEYGIRASVVGAFAAIEGCIFTSCTHGVYGAVGAETAPDTNVWYDNGADWTNYTDDANPIYGDPVYDAPSYNYELQEGSAAIDVGPDLGITEDIDHAASWRPKRTGYDCGCYEADWPDPPAPPTPLSGRRHEIHRIWHGGTIGTITIGVTTYSVSLPGGRYTMYDLASELETAAETATGLLWTAYLSPDYELSLAAGLPWEWAGAGGWNAFAGWVDGAVSGAPATGYILAGQAYACAAPVCAVRLSWPRLHPYRQVRRAPNATIPVGVAVLDSPGVDFGADIICGHDSPVRWWLHQEVVYYRGTATEWVPYADVDGWVVLRPLSVQEHRTIIDAYAGQIEVSGMYHRIEGDTP